MSTSGITVVSSLGGSSGTSSTSGHSGMSCYSSQDDLKHCAGGPTGHRTLKFCVGTILTTLNDNPVHKIKKSKIFIFQECLIVGIQYTIIVTILTSNCYNINAVEH